MKKRPLILSSLSHDVHAAAVAWGLEQIGLEPIWMRSPADANVAPISLHTDGQTTWRASGWLDEDSIGAVWFRRARNPETFPRADARDAPFLATEWARFLRNVYALADDLSGRLWVNRPSAAAAAENKLVQLRAARRCGLRFPPTLVSHDPRAIRRFVESHGRAIYKTFMPHTWKDAATGRMFGTFVRILEPGMLADDESLAICPGIYQAYVDKRHDLRVVAIGDRFFTVSLGSSAGETPVDWRALANMPELRAEPAALPDACGRRLQAMMRELGIVFGCIDLAVDADGDVHFLEVNQAGQFLFVEELVESMPLLRAMCAMLGEGRTDYSLDALDSFGAFDSPAARNVSYRAYLDSDHHHAWWESVRDQVEAESQDGAWLTIE
jgi:hypothetical protein